MRIRALTSSIGACARRLGRAVPTISLSCLAGAGCGSDTPISPTPITISCPANQAVDSPDGKAIAVSYTSPATAGGTPPVSTACSPASGSLFAVGSTTVGCQASDSSGRTASCTFTVAVTVPPQLLYTKLTAFGDSITEGKASEPVSLASSLFRELSLAGPAQAEQAFYQSPEPYPAGVERRLEATYPLQSFTVVNAGLGGERASNAVPRFRTMLVSTSPEVVLLMEGTNDMSSATGSDPALAALDQMITAALAQNRPVCLATIPPIRADGLANRAASAARVPPFNQRVRSLAASRRVILVDVYNAMKGNMNALIGIDDLHPTEQGIAVIADTFTTTLRANFERKPGTEPTGQARW